MADADEAKQYEPLTNYISFREARSGRTRIGHYNHSIDMIQPLSFLSGTPITDLYQVIEAGEANIQKTGDLLPKSSVTVLPPIAGRDILCVGKNYAEHAKEFNSSGFDSSDKIDQPSHPVIFTKRFTSIIADGEDIYPHPGFTETADYEGEIGVLIGKAGFRISEADAMSHVWGYTIINDITARERQRDHKQFYIGKSPDTFCPMGPIAVPAKHLPEVLSIQTHVNGENRQEATTKDLIFSIPFLIKTMSEGQTLIPGDVLATGTPAGVGIGRNPPVYLKPGDDVAITVSGLGQLKNRVGSLDSSNPTLGRFKGTPHLNEFNTARTPDNGALKSINGKHLHYEVRGAKSGSPIMFVHGLGGTMDDWTPLLHAAGLDQTHRLHMFELEGHGLSRTAPLNVLSIESFAADLNGIFEAGGIPNGATLISHSMGCLVAIRFALEHPEKVSKLVLIGPPPSPLVPETIRVLKERARLARAGGMRALVDEVITTETSEATKTSNPLALTAIRLSLLAQDPECYAKACDALANATQSLRVSDIQAHTLIIAGSEDIVSSASLCQKYAESLPQTADLHVLENVGRWHVFEDAAGVASALSSFL